MYRVGFRLLCVLGALCGLAGCESSGQPAAEMDEPAEAEGLAAVAPTAENLPEGVTAEQVELGRKLFLPCAVCHGLDGAGTQLGPSLRNGEWIHIAGTLEEIEGLIRTGVPSPRTYPVPMVPMGGGAFDAEELRSVASYVYALSHWAPSAPVAP